MFLWSTGEFTPIDHPGAASTGMSNIGHEEENGFVTWFSSRRRERMHVLIDWAPAYARSRRRQLDFDRSLNQRISHGSVTAHASRTRRPGYASRGASSPQRTSECGPLQDMRHPCAVVRPVRPVRRRGRSRISSSLGLPDPCAVAIASSRGLARPAVASYAPRLVPANGRIRRRGLCRQLFADQRSGWRAMASVCARDSGYNLRRARPKASAPFNTAGAARVTRADAVRFGSLRR
jgi:hypothetical protein